MAISVISYANGESLTGKQFKLDWTESPDGHPAQVEWIEIQYRRILPVPQEFDPQGYKLRLARNLISQIYQEKHSASNLLFNNYSTPGLQDQRL